MALRRNEELTPDVKGLIYQVTALSKSIQGPGGINEQLAAQNQSIQSLLTTRAATPAAPVSNLLWNGELGHSRYTWNETSGTPSGDRNEEAAWWFSHNQPAVAASFLDANVNTSTDTITITAHGFTTGLVVDLYQSGGGALPTGLSAATAYYVIKVDANNIKLATTAANAFAGTPVVDITSAAAGGTHYVQPWLFQYTYSSVSGRELKSYSHTTYDGRYSRWDPVNGWAELTGTTTVDSLLPTNFIDASTPLARIGLIAAKRNEFIEIPSDCRFAAGIWDNTSAQRKFLAGTFAFTAVLSGTAGATTRKYKALITSDRGYSLLSDEVTISNAPADGAFSSTSNIVMSWPQQAGQLQVEIYELVGGQYRLIAQVSGATSYIHLGSYLSIEGGYPTASGSELSATFYTRTGEAAALATNGVSATWDTVTFPTAVPSNYNKGNTTDRQWLRVWLSVAPNLYITGCSNTLTTFTIPTGAINSAALASGGYGTGTTSLYAGLTVQIYDSAGTLLTTTTVYSVTSDTEIILNAAPSNGTGRILRIVGGGFHGVLIDKIHLGYQLNTSYAPNPLDIRTLQPRALPASSTQGGVGTGGGTGGGVNCVAAGTPIKLDIGIWKPIQTTRPGQKWSAAGLQPNTLIKLREAMSSVRRVRSANGCEVICTDTEKFVTDRDDHKGTALYLLRVGDPVLTEIDDRIEVSRISEISPILGQMHVYTPTLSDNNLFIAGAWKPGFWQRLRSLFTRRKTLGGFVLHNQKLDPDDPYYYS